MTVAAALPLGIVAVALVVPLAREYSGLRAELALGRFGALLASSLLVPALAVGLAASLPLAETPALQWAVAVAVTLGVYSASVALLRPALVASRAHRGR